MGQEVRCSALVGGKVTEGKALLETDELVFRGDDGLRLRVPFKEMRAGEVRNGELRFQSPEGPVALQLGGQAEKWASRILSPKSLIDKLGVKVGMRVLVLGVEDEGFLADLRARTDEFEVGKASYSARPTSASGRAERDVAAKTNGEACDVVFVAVDSPGDLPKLAELKRAIKPDGAVWAVFRRGRKDFNENDVLRGGLDAGLVDVKVARFSETHTASKFVIRRAER